MTTMQRTKYNITAGDYQFSFLSSGDVFEISYKTIMINQLLSNPIDGALNNLFLRVHREGKVHAYPLLGAQSNSLVSFAAEHVTWEGNVEGIGYKVTFHLTEQGVWFWDVQVDGKGTQVDMIYGQDVGMADKDALRNNEAYVSQYMDHNIFEDDQKGYVVCSRQNQPQSVGFPYLQQGGLTKSVGFSTDGFQFFGKTYKETNQADILTKPTLENNVYQYEFAYIALQSERVTLAGKQQFIFYGLFQENHEQAVTTLEHETLIADAWRTVNAKESSPTVLVNQVSKSNNIGNPLTTERLTQEELDDYFPARHQEEWDGDTLLSFFTDTYEHIVLRDKELLVERPHGHIIMSGQNHQIQSNTITSTSWMYGVFNAQLVVGNTNFNKMLSNTRNALNIHKTSGQRIYVKTDDTYHLLALPTAYELGFNYARWYYKTATDTFVITNYTTVDKPEVRLHVRSLSGKNYRYLITNQVVMQPNEYEVPFEVEQSDNTLTFTADPASTSADVYPNLTYQLRIDGATFSLADETKLATNVTTNAASLVVCELEEASEWNMTIQGQLHGEELPSETRSFASERERYRSYYHQVMKGFQLTKFGQKPAELNKVNALAWWYTHNMLVHFSVPHGLEQYSGAAWGTRDVCQGPTEYFFATQNYDSIKDIIKTVYAHQCIEEGNWPQWFMFDRYGHIQADESHGDVIVWPLKVIADYLEATSDYQILQEKVPYTSNKNGFRFTEETATIYDHITKQLSYIKAHFLHDTHLSSYGDGDWDDTLQPANAQLKQYMVSSWTVALTYQVMQKLSKTMEKYDQQLADELASLVAGIEKDFSEYMLQTDVIPGFLYMENPEQPEMMLHPADTKTGIHYRLLPMQRSIISELLTPAQAESNYQLIKQKLYCPDGVRLMNRPANYSGGVSRHFKRAEQAANFGREIGLQYVHAHIRYVEAMAKLGKEHEVWQGLQMINPIGIQAAVPNAEIRQSNAYFSSSDGKFATRYDAQEQFDKLRDGSVSVKGGWRIYSSGPGIYMNQLISNCLGIRQEDGALVIDPILPETFDGVSFDFEINEKAVTFVYHTGNSEKRVVINGKQVENGKQMNNRYRPGGIAVTINELHDKCKQDINVIDIYF
ncbi:GH36-type glycosyl hydrolase domain-containing protein [Radiobacillus sp. PE A8.2]|uniref:GH36-type glycosyl hydrolase domain-containing protein n=1 Tax=Radiobacillus sp. PE A8.2 TaxID=3380349 RepID=UPI00388DA28A